MEFFENPEKLDRVRKNYRELKNYFPNTFIIKGDSRKVNEINQEIIDIIEKKALQKSYKNNMREHQNDVWGVKKVFQK